VRVAAARQKAIYDAAATWNHSGRISSCGEREHSNNGSRRRWWRRRGRRSGRSRSRWGGSGRDRRHRCGSWIDRNRHRNRTRNGRKTHSAAISARRDATRESGRSPVCPATTLYGFLSTRVIRAGPTISSEQLGYVRRLKCRSCWPPGRLLAGSTRPRKKSKNGETAMRRTIIALLATTALAVPAFASSHALNNQSQQQPQEYSQQSQQQRQNGAQNQQPSTVSTTLAELGIKPQSNQRFANSNQSAYARHNNRQNGAQNQQPSTVSTTLAELGIKPQSNQRFANSNQSAYARHNNSSGQRYAAGTAPYGYKDVQGSHALGGGPG
jgi:hypothetical protein